jgi:RecA-family ATPase
LRLDALKQHKNWVCWQMRKDGDQLKKTPVDVKTGRPASSSDPATWAGYDECKAAVSRGDYHSLGFALTREVGLVVVDFDKVCQEPGAFPEWVRQEIAELDSYTEISASKRGAHVLVWGSIPENYNRQALHVEIWGHDKMFAFSEDVYEGRDTIEARDVTDLHQRINRGAIGPNYKPNLKVERYSTPRYRDLANDDWEKHGYGSRSEAAMSVLSTLAAQFNGDADAIRREFEKTKIGAIRVEQGKWPRLADREIERAVEFAEKHPQKAAAAPVEFQYPAVPRELWAAVLKANYKRDGWFPLGCVSIIAGASGSGKSTLMYELLRVQRQRQPYLGHEGAGLRYLVLIADRGEHDHAMMLDAMGMQPGDIPMRVVETKRSVEGAAQEVLSAIEGEYPNLPSAVFFEGADLVSQDAADMGTTAAFFSELRRIAAHYNIAFIVSMGAAKSKPKEVAVLTRDRVFGSTASGRIGSTIATLTQESDGTTGNVLLTIQHRHAKAETFKLAFDNSSDTQRLVVREEDAAPATDEAVKAVAEHVEWAKEVRQFKTNDFKRRFKCNGSRAKHHIQTLCNMGAVRPFGDMYELVTSLDLSKVVIVGERDSPGTEWGPGSLSGTQSGTDCCVPG